MEVLSSMTASQPQKPEMASMSAFSHPVYKRLSQFNGAVNKLKKDELISELANLRLSTGGDKDVLRKRLKNYYKQRHLAQTHVAARGDELLYDYILVIDFEATCDSSNPYEYRHEIIEFPVVVIDCSKNEVVDTFQSYVRPVLNPTLTPFCIQLTGITQEQVKVADTFPAVLNRMWSWVKGKGYHRRMAVLTDGPWDMSRFMFIQCSFSQLHFPKWAKKWINIRKSFSNFYGCRRLSLRAMLETLGLSFEGNPHCGLDDSRNIARIAIRLLQDGCKLIVNERLYKSKNMVCNISRREAKNIETESSEQGVAVEECAESSSTESSGANEDTAEDIAEDTVEDQMQRLVIM